MLRLGLKSFIETALLDDNPPTFTPHFMGICASVIPFADTNSNNNRKKLDLFIFFRIKLKGLLIFDFLHSNFRTKPKSVKNSVHKTKQSYDIFFIFMAKAPFIF